MSKLKPSQMQRVGAGETRLGVDLAAEKRSKASGMGDCFGGVVAGGGVRGKGVRVRVLRNGGDFGDELRVVGFFGFFSGS